MNDSGENIHTHTLLDLLLTLVRTKAPFLVIIIASGGTTPQFAITSSLTSAGVVLLTKEHKGEVAGFSLRIPTENSGICSNITTVRKQTVVAAF